MPPRRNLQPDAERSSTRRREAAIAGHTRDVARARELSGDEDPTVRATALGALARLASLRTEEVVVALADGSPTVRRRAAELVATHDRDGPGAWTGVSLLGLLADHDDTVVEVAAWASGERAVPEPGVVATLAEVATGHTDAMCREAAVAALGAIGDEAGLPAILTATTDKATVRRRAIIALAPFEGEAVDQAFARAKQDRDWQVRQAAEDLSS